MDPKEAPLYPHLAEYLPRHGPPPSEDWEDLFIHSVSYVEQPPEDFLLVRALVVSSKRTVDLIFKGLVFVTAMPAGHEGAVRVVVSRQPPVKRFTTRLFNGDRKLWEPFEVLVYRSREAQRKACSLANQQLAGVSDTGYTFGDYNNTFDGCTVALVNGVLCSTLFQVHPSKLDSVTMTPADLSHDTSRNEDFVKNLAANLPFIRREGAFDIECVIADSFMGPETDCAPFFDEYFHSYREMFEKFESVKSRFPAASIEKPPMDGIVMKRHRVTSVALVVGNYHLGKRHRKDLLVYYDRTFANEPLDTDGYREKAASISVDIDRVRFVGMDGEYNLLKAFLKELVNSVDTLYVYHANFDVSVILQRIRYYAFRGQKGCCPWHTEHPDGSVLEELWENFLSKQPDIVKGKVILGNETLRHTYTKFINGVSDVLAAPNFSWEQKMASVRRSKDRYLNDKSKVQNLRMNCYGTEIIDLYLIVNQSRFDECKNGKLDTKAHYIINMFKPHKNQAKMRKLGDVSYDKLDEGYKAGGVKLAECLVYNLVDSQLLMRVAKCIGILQEYIYRQISTLNLDQMVHTRGQMQFNSCIGSVKSVEISRLKARMDIGILRSTGKLNNFMFIPETIDRRGGFVMTPLTGLSVSGPGKPFECIVDFASLYPSIMCDLNISPETIVEKSSVGGIDGYVCYDWSTVDMGFEKYTLVLSVDRSGERPVLRRHFSDTGRSLLRYLAMRNHHKGELKKAKEELDRVYHNKLQSEMKICANSHYGTSDQTCSLMTTTQGQHKIKLVNKKLYEANMFPNYGDTDSTMFWMPTQEEPLDMDALRQEFDVEAMTEHVMRKLSDRVRGYISQRVQGTQDFINGFLAHISQVLLDDAISRMVLFVKDPLGATLEARPEKGADGRWTVQDPLTGETLDCSAAFRQQMLTKLEYENCSSVTCHVAKKMYVCLTHDIGSGGLLTHSGVKRRGMVAFKTSRYGPTETIMMDFLKLIYEGAAQLEVEDVVRYQLRPWTELKPGDELLLQRDHSEFALSRHRVLDAVRIECPQNTTLLWLRLVHVETGAVKCRLLLYQDGINISHLFDPTVARERELCFVDLAKYRAFSMAMGVIPWSHVVRYTNRANIRSEFEMKKEGYGLFKSKDFKISYVNLLDKKMKLWDIFGTHTRLERQALTYPQQWVKQDPAFAFMRHYPVDMNTDTLIVNYFGPEFLCEALNFVPPPPPEGTVSQLHIKSFIDSHYFDPRKSKCLAHVVCDLYGIRGGSFEGTQEELGRHISSCVKAVRDLKAELITLLNRGSDVFYAINRNVPNELRTSADAVMDETTFCYDMKRDATLKASGKNLTLMMGGDSKYPTVLYQAGLRRLLELRPAVEDTLIAFKDLSEPFTRRTLTVLPPQIAEDLGVKPQLVLVTDTSENKVLLEYAQMVYYMLVGLHATHGTDVRLHVPKLSCLEAPPVRATPAELKEFFARTADYIKEAGAGYSAHCGSCLNFWLESSPQTIVSDNYTYDGTCFVLKRQIC